jgi:hypothetical protein
MKLLGEEFVTTNNTTSIPSREKNKNSTSVECVIELKFHVTELKTFEPHNLTAVRNKMPPQSVVAHHEALLRGRYNHVDLRLKWPYISDATSGMYTI